MSSRRADERAALSMACALLLVVPLLYVGGPGWALVGAVVGAVAGGALYRRLRQ